MLRWQHIGICSADLFRNTTLPLARLGTVCVLQMCLWSQQGQGVSKQKGASGFPTIQSLPSSSPSCPQLLAPL